ncbi:MAG TPA: DUF2244 domain-containing protein [Burkholderiales bacterium]
MSTSRSSLVLKRNCSMSPRALAAVFAALAAVVLLISAVFTALGAWLVLPFAGLEVLLLGGAFVAYARHAADYERIDLEPGRVRVEVADGGRTERYALDVASVALREGRVLLRGAREEMEIGRYLGAEARIELAAELEQKLIRGRIT